VIGGDRMSRGHGGRGETRGLYWLTICPCVTFVFARRESGRPRDPKVARMDASVLKTWRSQHHEPRRWMQKA
jgi:hypothetical protein